jgi:uncharacterized protein (TIRG00374 family)
MTAMVTWLRHPGVKDPIKVRTSRRRWFFLAGTLAVLALLTTELAMSLPSLTGALYQLRKPHLGWLALAVVAELLAMSAYARMQRRLLRSAGVRASHLEHLRLAYAAHSLNETLPGGAAFSTRLNYQQMRRLGASPGVASWVIALSGVFSATALAVIAVGDAFATGDAIRWSRLIGLLAAAALLILGVRHVARRREHAEALIRTPLALLNRLQRRPAVDGYERVSGFLDQLRAARLTPAQGLAAAVVALLNWFLDAVCLWLCFYAVGVHPAPLPTVVLAFCVAMAAGTVTVVPGGLGIIDSALLLGLVTAGGVALPAAIATVVLYRMISFGLIVGLGWFAWLHIRLSVARPPVATRSDAGAPLRTKPRTTMRRIAACLRHSSVPGAPARLIEHVEATAANNRRRRLQRVRCPGPRADRRRRQRRTGARLEPRPGRDRTRRRRRGIGPGKHQ